METLPTYEVITALGETLYRGESLQNSRALALGESRKRNEPLGVFSNKRRKHGIAFYQFGCQVSIFAFYAYEVVPDHEGDWQ